jgi:hypothetical protein
VAGTAWGSPSAKLAAAAIGAPTAQPTALAPNGSWRGPRLSSTVPRPALVAPAKIAARPSAGACALSADENSTATPPSATTAPSSLAGVRRSSPNARAMSALDSGSVAYTTAASPDGTTRSPQ